MNDPTPPGGDAAENPPEEAINDQTVDVTFFEPVCGRIVSTARCVESLLPITHPDLDRLVGVVADPMTQFVDVATAAVVERPTLTLTADRTGIAADGADTAVITGIPDGATVVVRGEAFTGDGTALEYSTTQAGAHTLRVVAFPYRDAEVTIHAH